MTYAILLGAFTLWAAVLLDIRKLRNPAAHNKTHSRTGEWLYLEYARRRRGTR